ncbi:aspartate carbamoyltransferase catalytic subunit [Texcoconibacillus texcoconensis]|uniref:Aspartate carbamoyltransferase n=1 Tax=Texcoconibacillus texcoconensis TaxID=1095777 RepID=A0A840QLB0_9BACI|nr:aspartate carbamoyltransferase catalytic subunit [Texcoconibacillus texcoconensis]MBB5172148.1 aspartate carbamoyltransferase catalytic subunit [Texcoconibacillus texcoconensis]
MDQLLSMEALSIDEVLSVLEEADAYRNGKPIPRLDQYTIANLFFEPSTRTKLSFVKAEQMLGMNILPFDDRTSSVVKGESLYDTVKTLEAIGCDAVVIRHPENQYYQSLKGINIPVLNAGDGSGEHPTQSLLDLLTIFQEFKTFQGLNIVICGDIAHSRVAKSNAQILERLGANVYFSGPNMWLDETTNDKKIPLDRAVEIADVMMMLRIQFERHDDKNDSEREKNEYHHKFGLTVERAARMKKHAIIMHPAPVNRGVEMASELVEAPSSRIFKQIENGVLIRTALLHQTMAKKGVKHYENMV